MAINRLAYWDRTNSKWISGSSDTSQVYTDAATPYIRQREKIALDFNVYDVATDGTQTAYTGWDGAFTFRFFIDNDWTQVIDSELAAGVGPGAITLVTCPTADFSTAPLTTGRLILTNGAGLSETVDYTSYVTNGANYDFTCSTTLTNTYLTADDCDLVESNLVEAQNSDIDSTNKATGRLIVTLDADNTAYIAAAQASSGGEITDSKWELQVLDGSLDLVDSITGEFKTYALLADDFSLPPPGPSVIYQKVFGQYSNPNPEAIADTDRFFIYNASDGGTYEAPASQINTYIGTSTGLSTLTNADRVVGVASAGVVKELTIEEGSITGLLTFSKTGTTARTVTFPDRALAVAGTGAATTNGTIAKFDSNGDLTDAPIVHAAPNLTIASDVVINQSSIFAITGQATGTARGQIKSTGGSARWYIDAATGGVPSNYYRVNGVETWVTQGTASAYQFIQGTSTELARFDSATGNLGINTTGPDRKLDVLDTAPQIRWTRVDGTTYGEVEADASGYSVFTASGSRFGFGATPAGTVHVDQASTSAAIPALILDQADVDEPFMKFIGTAAGASTTNSLVAIADVSTATVAGYAKVEVEDIGNQITDQDYYIPLYTLT